jgi:rubredoxin
MKTWKILSWLNKPERITTIGLCCPHCGVDAELEIGTNLGSAVIAAIGLSLVFDNPDNVPPDNAMPDEVQCRSCRLIFTDKETA